MAQRPPKRIPEDRDMLKARNVWLQSIENEYDKWDNDSAKASPSKKVRTLSKW